MNRLERLLAETRGPRIAPGPHKAELAAGLRAMARAGARDAWPLRRYAAALAAAAALLAVVLARPPHRDARGAAGAFSAGMEMPELARPDLVIPGLETPPGGARPAALRPVPEMARFLAHRLRDDADPSRAVWSPD